MGAVLSFTCCMVGVPNGVNVHHITMVVHMTGRNKSFYGDMKMNRRMVTEFWLLQKITGHGDNCVSHNSQSDRNNRGTLCVPAYSAKQVPRLLYQDVSDNPIMSAKEIANTVRAKSIYTRNTCMRHYRAVNQVLVSHMTKTRGVKMAAMEGYVGLLREFGYTVEMTVISGKGMKRIRTKATQYIFNQFRKGGMV